MSLQVVGLLAWALQAAPAKAPLKPPAPPVLEGVVKGPDGKPVEKALVLARPAAAPPSDIPGRARTDAAGRFRLELRSDRPHDLRVVAAGLAALRREAVRPGAPLTLVLGRGAVIEGVVRDSQTGAPVARARVTAREDGPLLSPGLTDPDAGLVTTATDAQGRFRLEGLAPGVHAVAARGPGGAGRKAGVRVGGRVEIVLVPGATLFGRVTGRQGHPVAGAVVSAYREERGVQPPDAPLEKTDAAGRYEVAGLAPGTYSLTVSHPDFAPGVRVGLAVERETATSADVPLEAGSVVRGRLVDEGGRPRAGQVAIQEVEDREAPPALAATLTARAAADGSFELPRLSPGAYALGVAAPGLVPQRVELAVPPSAGRPVEMGDIVLEAGIAIRGRVRARGGAPLPGAEVRARLMQPPFGPATPDVPAAPDGSFVLAGLGEGRYLVGAAAPGYAMASAEAAAGSEGVDLVLTPAGSITGLVVDEAGQPVEGATVTLDSSSRDALPRLAFLGRPSRTSDAEGRFLLEDLPEGNYAVQAEAPDLAPNGVAGVAVSAGRTADAGRIRLRVGGLVRGTVNAAGGGAVGGATVMVRPSTGDWRSRGDGLTATTGSAGAFEVRGVPPGSASVLAVHPRHAPGNANVDVDPAKGPAEARLVLGEGGRIEGWARRRDGAPLRGRIAVSGSRFMGRGRSDVVPVQPNGSFVVEHVDPGVVQVTLVVGASSSPTRALSKEVEVREGETSSVELTSREILLSGQVTRRGAPLARVRVSARGRGRGGPWFGMAPARAVPGEPQRGTAVTGDDGRYEMLLDEPGDVRLRVETFDGQNELASRREVVPDADAHVADFALAGVIVSGVVLDQETDEPVVEANVSAVRQDGEGQQRARTGSDGRFTLELEPGEYRLAATGERYNVESLAVTVGEEGLSDLRLELIKGP